METVLDTVMETLFYIMLILIGLFPFIFGLYCIPKIFLPVWREEKPLSYLLLIVLVLLYISVPAFFIYTGTDFLFAKPKPSNLKELFVEGERMMEYQDTARYCNSRDTTHFISRIPVNRRFSRNDKCIICGKKLRNHNTPFEQWLYSWLTSDDEYIPYYYSDMY